MPQSMAGKALKSGSWTPQEDQLLADWQAKYGNRWSSVAKKIPGRSGQQCAQRWRHKVNPNLRKAKWTAEEDAKLAALIAEHGPQWAVISRHMDGRSDQQVMGRWRRHLDPSINRDSWKAKEDSMLLDLYEQHGCQWAVIAKQIPGRTAQQTRARWFQMEAAEDGQPKAKSARKSTTKKKKPKKSDAYDSLSDISDGEEADAFQESGGYEELGGYEEAYGADEAGSYDEAEVGSAHLYDRVYVAEPVKLEEYDEEDEPSPPYQLSTPLKRAYSRAMSNSRATAMLGQRCSSSSRATIQKPTPQTTVKSRSPHTAAAGERTSKQLQRKWAERRYRGRDDCSESGCSSAEALEDDVYYEEEGRGTRSSQRWGFGRRSGSKGVSELASPPLLSPSQHRSAMASESQLMPMHSRSLRCAYLNPFFSPPPASLESFVKDSRSPSARLASPRGQKADRTPARMAKLQAERGRVTPKTPHSGVKRRNPAGSKSSVEGMSPAGAFARLPAGQWRLSPEDNGLVTPEWAKRRSASALPAEPPNSAPPLYQDGLPSMGRPLQRGPVARRLNINEAMRGRVERRGEMQEAMQTVPQEVGSPAKKYKSQRQPQQPSPFHLQNGRHRHLVDMDASSSGCGGTASYDTLSLPRTLTDKENSTCNALDALTMVAAAEQQASAEEASSAQTRHEASMTPPPLSLDLDMHELRSAILAPRLAPGLRHSSHVRMRLHAILDDL